MVLLNTYLVSFFTFGIAYRACNEICRNKNHSNRVVCGFMFRNLAPTSFLPMVWCCFVKSVKLKLQQIKKYTIQQHITRDKHLRGIQKRNDQTTSLTQPMYSEYGNSNFNLDLCRAFLSANIPLHKLSHPILRNFLENYTNKTIPDSSTLSKIT